jgi:hypothetical protein
MSDAVQVEPIGTQPPHDPTGGVRPIGMRAVVTFREPGHHRWPNAPDRRAYLRYAHRHLFHVTVALDLLGDDREVEFHDLLDHARGAWGYVLSQAQGTASCEQLAVGVGQRVALKYPGRSLVVEVWEDGESGAVVEFAPTLGGRNNDVPSH